MGHPAVECRRCGVFVEPSQVGVRFAGLASSPVGGFCETRRRVLSYPSQRTRWMGHPAVECRRCCVFVEPSQVGVRFADLASSPVGGCCETRRFVLSHPSQRTRWMGHPAVECRRCGVFVEPSQVGVRFADLASSPVGGCCETRRRVLSYPSQRTRWLGHPAVECRRCCVFVEPSQVGVRFAGLASSPVGGCCETRRFVLSHPSQKTRWMGHPAGQWSGFSVVVRLEREETDAGPSTHHPQAEVRLGPLSLRMTPNDVIKPLWAKVSDGCFGQDAIGRGA